MILKTRTTQRERLTPKNPEYVGGLLGISVLMVINLLWFRDKIGFLGVHPHPYWIVILLIATRYGFRGGVWTGFLAAGIYLAMLKMGRHDLSLWELADTRYLVTPVLFLVVGMIVGEIREVQKRKFEQLETDHESLREAFDQFSRSYEAMDKANQELDTRIISQEHTLFTLYAAAHGLKSLQEKEIYPAVLELVKDFLSAEACSIYMLSDNRLKLVIGSGDPAKLERKKAVDPDDGMMGRAFSSGETVSLNFFVSSKDFSQLEGSEIIISAPLVSSNKQTLGVLNIEKLPFVKFNPQTVHMTSLLADWCGVAVENARTYKETKDRNISDEITHAYTYTYLQERLREEFSRARRYKQPLSVLSLDIVDFSAFSDQVKQDVLTVLSLVLKNKLRTVDLLFHGSDTGRYIIILPSTPVEGALIPKQRILDEINAFMFKPYEDDEKLLHIEMAEKGLSEDMKGPEDLIPKASVAFERRRTQVVVE